MPCSAECVASAPDGWFGPYVQPVDPGTGDETSCEGDYPDSIRGGVAGAAGDDAECGCSCGAPTGGACEDPLTVQVYDQDQNGFACSTITDTILTADTPFSNDTNGSGINVRILEPDVTTAPTCAPSATENIDPIELGASVELCGGGVAEGDCEGDEVCVPELSAGFISAHCVYTEGDVPCPVGTDFSNRTVYFAEITDTRDCSSCSCGAAQNTDCDGSVSFFATYIQSGGGFVTDPAEVEPATGACRQIDPNLTPTAGVTYGMVYDPETPTSSGCNPIGGDAQGSVSADDAFTVCCTP